MRSFYDNFARGKNILFRRLWIYLLCEIIFLQNLNIEGYIFAGENEILMKCLKHSTTFEIIIIAHN